MERLSVWVLLGLTMLALSLHEVEVSADVGPSESECRPYIEKAIHELKTSDTTDDEEPDKDSKEEEQELSVEDTGPDIDSKEDKADDDKDDDDEQSAEQKTDNDHDEKDAVVETVEETVEESLETTPEANGADDSDEAAKDSEEKAEDSNEAAQSQEDGDDDQKSEEDVQAEDDGKSEEENNDGVASEEDDGKGDEEKDDGVASEEEDDGAKSAEDTEDHDDGDDNDQSQEEKVGDDNTDSGEAADKKDDEESGEEKPDDAQSEENQQEVGAESKEDDSDDNDEDDDDKEKVNDKTEEEDDDEEEVKSRGKRSAVEDNDDDDDKDTPESKEDAADGSEEDSKDDKDDDKAIDDDDDKKDDTEGSEEGGDDDDDEKSEEESRPEDDLLLEVEIPENLRDRKHIDELLHLEEEFEERENAIDRVAEIILRDLKRIYDNAIKPLETMYKYRDLSNRHYGDPEIFSKPLILFMGPWSGGKSSIINYLTDNEYTPNSLRTGAEPSPAYFNILMYGNETEVLDGTQLAADWTFSGLQKFGQGLEERLRGLKLPNKLLEKVNIVEIPGILEVRKQVSRLFPFNDACQWFIDRADIIFLVYDPAKLDVGPETEAILDQLKGREYQTRIILNKADTVKPEELLRVQSALIWNISPLMSSAQPPVMYTTSLWSHPYETSSPVRLLQAQERAFLRDIRGAIDKRIENKISSARRFAVRVRNHAKMVDCYLTTYYNHKTLFGNKKRISDQIIENPQNYHIYEGLSTLTNISRYDLPDPEVYRDFFHLNPLYEFKKLAETCTYFRGCPINKLDVAIAYDFPELVGKYKKMTESAISAIESSEKTEKSRS